MSFPVCSVSVGGHRDAKGNPGKTKPAPCSAGTRGPKTGTDRDAHQHSTEFRFLVSSAIGTQDKEGTGEAGPSAQERFLAFDLRLER